jgi:hypothetical protein
VQILVYETEPGSSSPATILTEQASALPGVTATLVGVGSHFEGFGSKYAAVLPILQTMPGDELVVLSDARDVLLNIPASSDATAAAQAVREFHDAFHAVSFQYPGAIVVSAEAQCCVSALTYVQPGDYFDDAGKRNKRACASGEADCLWNGDEMSLPWENFMKNVAQQRLGNGVALMDDVYLNAGLIVGKAQDLLRVFQAADIAATEDDQAVLTDYMFRNPSEIVLDYGQTLFGNNRGGMTDLNALDQCMFKLAAAASGKNDRLVHTKTDTSPLFVHSPGGFLQCHEDLSALLGAQQISTVSRRRLRSWIQKKCNYRGDACRADEKVVSGYCVSLFCFNDYTCPANSYRIDGRRCYNNFDDCACSPGYRKAYGSCEKV